MAIYFEVLGEPTGKGRPRIVSRKGIMHPLAITPDKTRKAEESFLAQALPYKPVTPLIEPLIVTLTLYCGVPKSWTKKKQSSALSGNIRPTGKPDIDNVVKLILDSMNGVFYLDDKQVVELHAEKVYDSMPRVHVGIEKLLTT